MLFKSPIENHVAMMRFREPEMFCHAIEKFHENLDTIKSKRSLSPSEFAKGHKFEEVNPNHEIYAISTIFFNKIGKFQETEQILKQAGFEPDSK